MSNNTGSDLSEVLRRVVEEVAVPVSSDLDGPALMRQMEETMATGGSPLSSSLLSSMVSSSLAPVVSKSSSGGAASWVSWVNPLVGGLMSLFDGGSDDTQAALAPFVMPAKQKYDVAFSENGGDLMMPLDRGEDGRVRSAGANVVVQVEAMDSRSFVDRAPEIAQAVKRALLESQGLSGVMQEF
ncbi:hypothetical protein [Paludibaculum fermentans]|uniref:Uncharacterized protein n=1 Tax=Paludibaculum fermentans TaxID=1473598 RepID=A0A7S7SLX4_PALFE|nr:hypothetical protein [Paludibaculum fermentans]QOY89303.1 hypothetical protein IRI77_04925 [Paludibaculum fermentans]